MINICICFLVVITDNDYEENIDIKEEEESEVSWVKEAIEANSSKSGLFMSFTKIFFIMDPAGHDMVKVDKKLILSPYCP